MDSSSSNARKKGALGGGISRQATTCGRVDEELGSQRRD